MYTYTHRNSYPRAGLLRRLVLIFICPMPLCPMYILKMLHTSMLYRNSKTKATTILPGIYFPYFLMSIPSRNHFPVRFLWASTLCWIH